MTHCRPSLPVLLAWKLNLSLATGPGHHASPVSSCIYDSYLGAQRVVTKQVASGEISINC